MSKKCSRSKVRGSTVLRKILLAAPISLLMVSGLTACGNNDQTTNSFQQVGYHTNDVNMVDHDGPITELLDYSLGNVDNVKKNNNLLPSGYVDDYDHPIQSPFTEYNTNNRGVNNNRILRDINYHGHLNHHNAKGKSSYYTAYEGALAQKLSDEAIKVPNVSDARALISDNTVLLSIVLKNDKDSTKTKANVEQAIRPFLNGRHYLITTDAGTYYRARDIDNDLKDGGPRDTIKMDLKNMIKLQKKQQ
ncbi:hypothetical protein B5V89_02765 [Heyndrickxia sporothermodurans]|nr:hypothetical protein B5V89_02765 [Heyndrickxia sporothermodurans]